MYYYYAYIENNICIDIERTRKAKTDLEGYVEVTENEYNAYMDEDTTSAYYIIGMCWNGSEWVEATHYYYAILNIKNIVVSVVASLTEINKDNYIPITEEEYTIKNCINCKWNTETEKFDEVPLSVYADADTTKISVNGSEVPLQTLLDAMQTEIDAKGGEVTATDILVALTTVDGAGSGVDSDTLDGHDSAYFARNQDVQAMMVEMGTKADSSALTDVAKIADLSNLRTELLTAIANNAGSIIKSIQRGWETSANETTIVYFETPIDTSKSIVLLDGERFASYDQVGVTPYLKNLTATSLEVDFAKWTSDLTGRFSWQVIEFY